MSQHRGGPATSPSPTLYPSAAPRWAVCLQSRNLAPLGDRHVELVMSPGGKWQGDPRRGSGLSHLARGGKTRSGIWRRWGSTSSEITIGMHRYGADMTLLRRHRGRREEGERPWGQAGRPTVVLSLSHIVTHWSLASTLEGPALGSACNVSWFHTNRGLCLLSV